jgi:glycosyltransferase involved in cell wall biosynthesis
MSSSTLVTPLRNEREGVEGLWNAIARQTAPPGEWIILDNGSTDGTREWLEERSARGAPFPVRVLSLPGRTIAAMMNEGIRAAKGDLIACCHGGTGIPEGWLASLLAPLADPAVDVAAGVWTPVGANAFERFVARTFPIDLERLDAGRFLPASRSLAFRKSAWEKVGGFPEWLPRFGEDTLFSLRLRHAGLRFALAREAKVEWRPKPTLGSFLRQERLYAEANALMGYLRPTWRSWLRPWAAVLPVAALGALTGSGWAATLVPVIPYVDYLRLRAKGAMRFRSFAACLFWMWVHPLAEQTGIVTALFRRVEVPPNDREAVNQFWVGASPKARLNRP